MKVFSSHQPSLLPHPGYWAKMAIADVWAHNDAVEFSKQGFQNRVKIGYGPDPQWFTLPVERNDHALLRDMRIADHNHRKLSKRLAFTYKGRPFWGSVEYALLSTLQEAKPGTRLVSALVQGIGAMKTALSISTPILELDEVECSRPSERNAIRTVLAGCDTYLAGPGGRGYLNEEPFRSRGLKVVYMDPVPEGPYSGRSVLSAFCDHGAAWAKAVYGG